MSSSACTIEGCERPQTARGWCTRHYGLWRRNGSPEKVHRSRRPGVTKNGLRLCDTCKVFRDPSLFSKSKQRLDGLRNQCRPCYNLYHQRLRYRLTPERMDELMEQCGGSCSVCSVPFRKTPHVDHDHSCCPGEKSCGRCVRGLVCAGCNYLIGILETKAEVLEQARNYLFR